VVVTVGVTITDPFAGRDPTPLSIVTPVALVVDQFRVAEPPAVVIVEGVAVKLLIVGAAAFTVTVVVAVAVPPVEVAVRVYVVVTVGVTVVDPLAGKEPTPVTVTLVALVVVQFSVEEPPSMMVEGVAEKLTIVGAGAVTITVVVAVTVPLGPVAMRV